MDCIWLPPWVKYARERQSGWPVFSVICRERRQSGLSPRQLRLSARNLLAACLEMVHLALRRDQRPHVFFEESRVVLGSNEAGRQQKQERTHLARFYFFTAFAACATALSISFQWPPDLPASFSQSPGGASPREAISRIAVTNCRYLPA